MDFAELRRRVPRLGSLMAGLFNQDWHDDFSSFEAACQVGFEGGGLGRRTGLLADIDLTLASLSSDDEIEDFFRYLNGYPLVEIESGLPPRAWLAAVRERVATTIRREEEGTRA